MPPIPRRRAGLGHSLLGTGDGRLTFHWWGIPVTASASGSTVNLSGTCANYSVSVSIADTQADSYHALFPNPSFSASASNMTGGNCGNGNAHAYQVGGYAIEPMMMPVSRSPHSAGDSPQAPCHRAYSPLVELRRSSAAEIRPLLPPMPYRGQRDRSAGTFPVSADHADGLNSPVSTLPCMSRSSLQQAFRLRQRIPAQRTPQNKEPTR